SKGASAVMVLSVNVIGDRAADRHELGARRYRKKPPPRHDELEQVSKSQAALAADPSLLEIGGDEAVQAGAAPQVAAIVQAAIAIAAALSVGKERRGSGRPQDGGDLVSPLGTKDREGLGSRIAAPAQVLFAANVCRRRCHHAQFLSMTRHQKGHRTMLRARI